MKVLLLAGGNSGEKDISKASADDVEPSLIEAGHIVTRSDPASNHFDLAQLVSQVDVVLPILHGEGGEDGRLQAQLEALGIPFLGSGSNASKIAYDKGAYKDLLRASDILTPASEIVNKQAFRTSALSSVPFVLKPLRGGSSIDTFIVRDPVTADVTAIETALEKYGTMLLEELIVGQEITVGILGNQALPIILITPPDNEEFDYENKYNGKTKEVVNPPGISNSIQLVAQQLALRIHNLLGCRHMSRTDMIITNKGNIYTLETNTIPGLTKDSLLPKAAQAIGISRLELVKQLISLTQEATQ